MLGLFNMFGRSRELRALDQALREAGVHPQAAPEAVKLATIRLLKERSGAVAYEDAAQLLAYCMLGREQFIDANGDRAAGDVEARLETAASEGEGRDAKLILLALHAGVAVPEVAELFDVETR